MKDKSVAYGMLTFCKNCGEQNPYSAKTLTDEEIKSEAKYFCHSWYSQNPERLVLFARAILRKAEE
jgi:hypothetical protein